MNFRKQRVIGLDIGCSSIKLAEFAQKGARPTLLQLRSQEIDWQKETKLAQQEALKKLFQDIDAKEAIINVVINCPQSTTRILTIPFMPKSEIPQALKWEMKNFVSVSIDEAALDYEILEEIVEGGVKKLKVCVVCSPWATVNRYLELLNQSGIQPDLFTQSGLAIKNIVQNFTKEKEETIAVLDIGYNFTELYIFKNNQLAFNRKLPVAGQNFTQDLAQVLVSDLGKTQLTPQEAETIKKQYGLPDSGSLQVLEGKLTSGQLLSLLRPNLEKLVTEVARSFDFYREKEQGTKVERLILLGGGSLLKNLAENLAQELGSLVEFGNPLKGLTIEQPSLLKNKSEMAHRFAQAIGVALSPANGANLLPAEIKEKTKLLIERSSIKAAVTAVIVILILLYMGMKIRLSAYDKRIAAAKLELNALAPHIAEVQKQAFLVTSLTERVYWSNVLKELGNRIPEQIRLLSLSGQGNVIMLKGEIKSANVAEEKVLTEFMNSLGQGVFKEVTLITSRKGSLPNQTYLFELKLSAE